MTKQGARTNAGVDWDGESIPGFAKIGAEGWLVREKLIVPNPDVVSGYSIINGGLSEDSMRRMEDFMGAFHPEFMSYYKEHSEHIARMGSVLIQRGRNSIINDELNTFRTDFKPIYDYAHQTFNEGGVITRDGRYAAQEQYIMLAYAQKPGLYIRIDPDRIEDIYVGEGKNAIKRGHDGSTNSYQWLVEVKLTRSKAKAKALEDLIIARIKERSDVKWKRGTRGFFRFNTGINAYSIVNGILMTWYREMFYATARMSIEGLP